METLVITLKNDKARKLLQDLEDLEILEVIDSSSLTKKSIGVKISDLKNKIASPMQEEAINTQLQEIRNEWQPNI
ncbi:MAG: hypothetical protein WKG06_28880 [Segetibacter sp.]